LIARLGGNKYFACVDMKGSDGKIYNIDFFMVPQPGKLTVTQTSVHRIKRQTSLQLEATRGRLEKVPVS